MPAKLPNQKFKLKYLFKLRYDDGSIFNQPEDDHSELDPKRSSFYDVLHSGKHPIAFGIFGNDHALVVDLKDGHFEFDGNIIHPEILPPGPVPLDLIFFRQLQQDLNVSYKVDEKGNPIVTNETPGEHRVKYFIGWQCTVNGKSYKQVLGLS